MSCFGVFLCAAATRGQFLALGKAWWSCCCCGELCRCRGRTVKTLESRPIQLVLCLLMMFDAAVVITEILLDLQAMRSKSTSHNASLHNFRKASSPSLPSFHATRFPQFTPISPFSSYLCFSVFVDFFSLLFFLKYLIPEASQNRNPEFSGKSHTVWGVLVPCGDQLACMWCFVSAYSYPQRHNSRPTSVSSGVVCQRGSGVWQAAVH